MATAQKTQLRYTPEDLLALPDDGKRYELVDGELVEHNMGTESSYIAALICRLLGNFVADQYAGWVLTSDAGYQCFPDDPHKVRRPDVSFIRRGRLPGEQLPKGYTPLPPDLAVEVISPHDLASELERKVAEYLRAGVSLVWVVDPDARTVRVHRGDWSATFLTDSDELSGEDVLPGFRCPVRALFPPAAETGPLPDSGAR